MNEQESMENAILSSSPCDLILLLTDKYLRDHRVAAPWGEFSSQVTKRAQGVLPEVAMSKDQASLEVCLVWGLSRVGE